MKARTDHDEIRSFYFRLIIPGVLTIAAFIVSIYFIFIPALEKNMVNQKKQMIRELTQSAWSILQNFNDKVISGEASMEDARQEAIQLIQMLRYGKESKDYFWVTDMQPVMVVHPYRPDLKGVNLEDYKDPNGKRLFVESISVVKAEGEGYIDYFWQWKDDSSRIVPKLSYVKGFEPWQWVVGTGIYMDDVEDEILRLEKSLIMVSILIIVFVTISLIYILRTGLLLESKRKKAVSELQESRERYLSLVEASNEGTLLSLDGRISYVNPFFLEMFGWSQGDLIGSEPDVVFDKNDTATIEVFHKFLEKDTGVMKFETGLVSKNGDIRPVLLTVSRIAFGDKKGSIFVARELSARQKMEKQIDQLGEELQTSLLFMNQPVQLVSRNPLTIFMNASIRSCAETMSRKKQTGILIRGHKGEFLGIVTDQDLRHRVIARGIDFNDPVYTIMSSPVVSIPDNSLLFEAFVSLQQNNVTHIAVRDSAGNCTGLISHEELLEVQQNTTAFLMRQIQMAEHADDLVRHSRKTRGIVKVLEQSGAKTRNITRIITSLTDAMTKRFVELAENEIGPPPVDYVFIALGSEGRGEQTLATDQDNGIIFREVPTAKTEETSQYFLSIGQKVNEWLNEAGYNFCKGKVMAGNPKWCKPLPEWKSNFEKWINNAEPQAILEASIFFDFRPVHGDFTLSEELREFVEKMLPHKEPFFYQMADQTLKFNTSNDISSLFQLDKASGIRHFDSKKIVFPITSFCRLYALYHQVQSRSTLSRLQSLNKGGKLSDELYGKISDGYDFLMMLRFKAQLEAIEHNLEINNMVPEDLLSDMDKIHLKKVIGTISEIQTKIKLDFNIS